MNSPRIAALELAAGNHPFGVGEMCTTSKQWVTAVVICVCKLPGVTALAGIKCSGGQFS